jgi:hypothetical protein
MSDSYQLVYVPTSQDANPGLAEAASAIPIGPFLLLKGEAYFVHGNSYVKLLKGGMDFSPNFDTWRRWRMWTVDCDAGIPGSGKDPSEWIDDNASGGPNWRDIPGEIFKDAPDQWDRACTLSEFVVAVAGHERKYGALYFFVLISTRQSAYRVQMSSAKPYRSLNGLSFKAGSSHGPSPQAQKSKSTQGGSGLRSDPERPESPFLRFQSPNG